MHYLLMQIILLLSKEGIATFNLGLSPLSKLDERLDKSLAERVLAAIKSLGVRYYSFDGLEQFKGKFAPEWQPRYISYQGGATRLPQVALGLNTATAYRTERRHRLRQWLPLAAAIVAGAGYASFPLAAILNPQHFLDGLASALGAVGQPYAWVFNGLDVVSALVAMILFAWMAWHYKPRDRWLKISMWAAFVASVGAGAAALLPLPEIAHQLGGLELLLTGRIEILAHAAASFANSAGYVVSISAWGWFRFNRHRPFALPVLLAIIAIFLGTIGTLIGWEWPVTAGILQRLFIILYMVWLIGLTYEVVNRAHKRPHHHRTSH
jgi:hypothetical protein